MATSSALKNRRSHARTKATKAVNTAAKLVKDDLTIIRASDLELKINAARAALEEHSEAHETFIEAMEAEGKLEAAITQSWMGTIMIEDNYDADLEKLTEALNQARLCAKNDEVQRDAALWFNNSTAKSMNFAAEGGVWKAEMSQLIKELTPYQSIYFFGDQLKRAEDNG